MGRAVVAKYLWAKRITTLDGAMMTAPHLHHFGGLQSLAELFPIKEFWSTTRAAQGRRFDSLERALETQKIRRVWISKEKRCRSIESVIICAREAGAQDTLALQLFYGKTEILLLSDGRQRDQGAAGDAPWKGRPTILKIPGHTVWQIDGLRPRLKVITGRERTPRDRLLEPLENPVPTFTTARDGAVTVESDGISIGIHGFNGRALISRESTQKE
jgi:beta-lactamase superfamily II metal-dependent hydrolase